VLALGAALFVSSLPTIAQLAARHEFGQLKLAYRKTVLRVLLGLSPMLAVAWYLAAWLLAKFAPAFTAALWPFRILMLGTFFMFMNQLSSAFIMALGKFRIIMAWP